jgi:hypothetical protein
LNERIKELAEQAREYATTRHPVSNIILSVNSDLFEQKFAELIVKECVAIANRQFSAATGLDDRDCLTAQQMKQHFGVEE